MTIYDFNVTHGDGITTTGSKDITAPGHSQNVNINQVPCLCGFNHNLIGTQSATSDSMSGSGPGSVVPANDPHGKPVLTADQDPSWSGTPGSDPHDGEADDDKSDQGELDEDKPDY